LIISLVDNGYAHLLGYNPFNLPFARLTNDPWDDIHPALSPDSTRLAFSSRRNGYWDLYILDLASGALTRLTDTLAYDGSPAWSPDGNWIAYETYASGNLDIAILSVADPASPPQVLTNSPAPETSPAWSPLGRQIAFVSTQDGDADIWSADLDADADRFTNLTTLNAGSDTHPAWSPDGASIAYASSRGDLAFISILNPTHAEQSPRILGSGSWPAWSPDGNTIAALIDDPNYSYLTAYRVSDGSLAIPPQILPAPANGIAWSGVKIPGLELQSTDLVTAGETLSGPAAGSSQRSDVISIPDVTAPQPFLNEYAVSAFEKLRMRIAVDSGWDFLATLENAYVPLTSPLTPGMGNDWLYTGRAIAFPSSPLSAGLMVVARENYSGQTYWRVFLKTRFQDGSQGRPLDLVLWDLNARNNGDPAVYDQGGKSVDSIPDGYWLDLTALASSLGWERIPALSNWRTLFPGTRFNELIYASGLTWEQAMLEVYPPEILVTPTQAAAPTLTPTRAPSWFKTLTPTSTVPPAPTPTPRPTWTPLPGLNTAGG
jgi:TolB protein